MIIVWGTLHAFKRNLRLSKGTCPHCGKKGTFKSYDCTTFFTLYFIPLIPTGKIHVTNSCPHCKKHLQIRLNDYNQNKQKALAETAALVERASADPKTALNIVTTLDFYNEIPKLYSILKNTEIAEMRNAPLQAALAKIYLREGKLDHASAHLALAQESSPVPDELLEIANLHLEGGREQDKAWEIIDEILPSMIPRHRDLLIDTAWKFTQAGMFDQAGKITETIEKLTTGDKPDSALKKLKKAIAKRKAVKAVPTLPISGNPDLSPKKTAAIVAGVILIAGILLFFALLDPTSFYVINGTRQHQTYTINGKTVKLRPLYKSKIENPEEKKITVVYDCPTESGKQTYEFDTNEGFFSRLFGGNIYIINPDKCGIFYIERILYSTSTTSKGPTYRFYTGKQHQVLSDVDYPFETAPDSISVEGETSTYRRALVHFRPDRDGSPWHLDEKFISRKTLIARAVERMKWDLNDKDLPQTMTHLMAEGEISPEKVREMLEKGLDYRPANIEWHRLYQELPDLRGSEKLVEEYKQRLDNHPDSNAYKYLYARLISETMEETAMKLFAESEKGKSPLGYGYNAMTYQYLIRGELGKATETALNLVKLAPNVENFRTCTGLALMAGEKWDALIQVADDILKTDAVDLVWANHRALATLRKSGKDEYNKWLEDYLRKLKRKYKLSNDVVTQYREILSSQVPFMENDLKAQHAARALHPDHHYLGAFRSGKPVLAEKHLSRQKNPQALPNQWLLVYSLAKVCDDQIVAERCLGRAANPLAKSPYFQRYAQILKMDPNDLESFKKLELMPEDKGVLALALSLKAPKAETRKFYRELAAQLTFEPNLDNLLAKRVLELAAKK